MVWSDLDLWATSGGCVGKLPLIADNREFVMSLSLESLSHLIKWIPFRFLSRATLQSQPFAQCASVSPTRSHERSWGIQLLSMMIVSSGRRLLSTITVIIMLFYPMIQWCGLVWICGRLVVDVLDSYHGHTIQIHWEQHPQHAKFNLTFGGIPYHLLAHYCSYTRYW